MTWTDLFLNNYGSPPIQIVRGEGSRVWDNHGKEYVDMLGGIAVNAVGVGDPRYVSRVSEQLQTLVHTSNLYSNPPSMLLAERLIELSGIPEARVFFCNSGAEANEAAFKLARLTGRPEVIVIEGSFHGRTMGALALTAQPAKQDPFKPLPGGVRAIPINDLDALRSAITDQTAAIFLEPIQGEGGVIPLTQDYMKLARELTTATGTLLIFDEVQTGMGRTGQWWGHQHSGVVPDAMTLAKGLGGGLPIGALLVGKIPAELFSPGSHGSTFGGNPVVASAALAVIEIIESDSLIARSRDLGARLKREIPRISAGLVTHVRGEGLLLAAVLAKPVAKEFEEVARDKGLLVNAVSSEAIRLAPALNITDSEVDQPLNSWARTTAELQR